MFDRAGAALLLTCAIIAAGLGLAYPALAAPFAYVSNWGEGTVSVIDTASDAVVGTVQVGGHPGRLAVNHVGTRLYVTKSREDALVVIDTSTNAVVKEMSLPPAPINVAVSPDDRELYVVHYQPRGSVSILDASTLRRKTSFTLGYYPADMAVSPSGKRVYVSSWYDRQ